VAEDDDHDAVGRKIVRGRERRARRGIGRHLADTYGTRGMEVARRVAQEPALGARIVPDRDDVLAQVDYAIDEEMATTLPTC
jgi:glycerol-3-phosphate dehydrogenase